MTSDYTMESHEDDSLTLTVGEYVVHVRASSWHSARDLAHRIATLLTTEREIGEARAKLKRTLDLLDDLHEATRDVARSLER